MHIEYLKIFSDLVEKKVSPKQQKSIASHSLLSANN